MSCTVALMTDFGLKDPYVGMMKAVIKKICPEAEIIDLTHGVPKFNVVLGAHILKISKEYFPKGTVFVGVVDPGVGSERKAIVVITKNYVFVGPDNGLLVPAAEDDGVLAAYEIRMDVAALPNPSHTFHGRDVFAPTGAYIACGVRPGSLGKELSTDSLIRVASLPKEPELLEGGVIAAEVIHVDDFGNIITSIDGDGLSSVLGVQEGDVLEVSADAITWETAKYVKTFSAVCKGCVAVYEGTYGLVEVAVNMGSAAERLRPGTKVFLRPKR